MLFHNIGEGEEEEGGGGRVKEKIGLNYMVRANGLKTLHIFCK